MTLVTSKANPIWHFRQPSAGPRRIVHVPARLDSEPCGGAESAVLDLAGQQLRSGMEPVIITSMALSETRHEIIGGIRVHRHPHAYPFFGPGAGGTQIRSAANDGLPSVPIFQSLMQEPGVRLFHAHTLDRLGGEVRTAARLRCRPFVITVHGVAHDPSADESSHITHLTSRKILEEADMVIFTEKHDAEHARATLGHDRIIHLPGGVDGARQEEIYQLAEKHHRSARLQDKKAA